jgi:hypothetical protein
MTSLTLPVSEEFKQELKKLSWINWSEIAREEALKKLIFEIYIKTGNISDDDWEFCENIDWHPADELPLKPAFKKKLERIKKQKFIKINNVDEIFK